MIKMSLFISILLSQLFAFAGNGDGGAGIVKPAAFSAMSAEISTFQASGNVILAGGEVGGSGIIKIEKFHDNGETYFLVEFYTDKGIDEVVLSESEFEEEFSESFKSLNHPVSDSEKEIEI